MFSGMFMFSGMLYAQACLRTVMLIKYVRIKKKTYLRVSYPPSFRKRITQAQDMFYSSSSLLKFKYLSFSAQVVDLSSRDTNTGPKTLKSSNVIKLLKMNSNMCLSVMMMI